MSAPKRKATAGEVLVSAVAVGVGLAVLEYAAPGVTVEILKALRQPQPPRTEPPVFLQRVPKEGARS